MWDERKEKTMNQHPDVQMRPGKETVQSPPHARKMARFLRCYKNGLGLDTPSCSLLFLTGKGFVLFAIFLLLFACSNEASSEKMASIEARLEQLEARSTQIEGQMKQIALLKNQIGKLEQSMARLEKLLAAKIKPKNITEDKTSKPKAAYHVVQQGEILSKIAGRYGMSLDELCRLNGITPKTVIHPGQQLVVTSRE